ncbi:MAG: tRNA1(Val) (adenine(37)-N6)-methyltransferase [Deltaproteobacteria bacterium]|nr:tRNA1(Val) (adenine(37)-N6)-methyltransferase [Deltaproteobacteria bacterium]
MVKISDVTSDTFFNGRLRIKQDRAGYRFSIDAVILAHIAGENPGKQVLDLGTGCGIIPLILAYRHPEIRIVGVEVQPELAELAKGNITDNQMADRIRIQCRDLKTLTPDPALQPFDLVLGNPPFYPAQAGRINPNRQRAIARHEITVTLSDVVQTASRMLETNGRFLTLYPAERLAEVLTELAACKLEARMLRMIHMETGRPAKLFVVEGVKNAKSELTIRPPLVIYNKPGVYSAEAARMYEPC